MIFLGISHKEQMDIDHYRLILCYNDPSQNLGLKTDVQSRAIRPIQDLSE